MEDLLRASEQQYRTLKHGDVIEGTVMKLGRDEILVDIGAKTEGIIPSHELQSLSPEEREAMQIGDAIGFERFSRAFDDRHVHAFGRQRLGAAAPESLACRAHQRGLSCDAQIHVYFSCCRARNERDMPARCARVVGQLSPDSRRIDAALPDVADIPFISIRLFTPPFR